MQKSLPPLIHALLATILAMSVGACGDDGEDNPAPVGGVVDAASPVTNGQPVATPGASPVQGPGAAPISAPASDAGMSGSISLVTDAAMPRDAGGGPIVITIPTRSVACGGSECTTTNNRTCCHSWSKDMGFVGTPMCTTHAACTTDHSSIGDTNRAVVNDCDEPGDCSTGQVCCFVRYGMPVFAELFSTDIVGPGASRLCMELSNCNAGTMTITGVAGIPVGIQACKGNADCKDGTQCVPESENSTTTGKNGKARPGVMVCK